jgi:hypothetical protein
MAGDNCETFEEKNKMLASAIEMIKNKLFSKRLLIVTVWKTQSGLELQALDFLLAESSA